MQSQATMNMVDFLPPDLALIKLIANRMRDPEYVKKIVTDPNNRNPNPLYNFTKHWSGLSIAGGYPGVLPIFIELAQLFPDEKWDSVAHQYIIKIKDSIESEGLNTVSMFGGLSGICYYIQQASLKGTRYQSLLSKLDAYLLEEVRKSYTQPLLTLLKNGESIPNSYYETIQGLSGIGIYLLTNLNFPGFARLIKEIISVLISMTYPITFEGNQVPGWHVPCESLFLEEERIENPKGNFNLGLSHGIPGVLAFLSIARLHGISQEGQNEAIKRIVLWLKEKRTETSDRFFWPTTISFEEEVSKNQSTPIKSRDAWCYGTPGIARSLYLAGRALKDENIKSYALSSFLSIFNTPEADRGIPCPTICHGISGLLLITHFMAKESGCDQLKGHLLKLREQLLSHYSPDHPFGFKTLDPTRESTKFALMDSCDLLEGVSGILMTLMTLHQEGCSWHLPFLIDSGSDEFGAI